MMPSLLDQAPAEAGRQKNFVIKDFKHLYWKEAGM